jgi:hypothetical protein
LVWVLVIVEDVGERDCGCRATNGDATCGNHALRSAQLEHVLGIDSQNEQKETSFTPRHDQGSKAELCNFFEIDCQQADAYFDEKLQI